MPTNSTKYPSAAAIERQCSKQSPPTRYSMSSSEPMPRRTLVVDTETPGTEIFITDAQGVQVANDIRRLETELPIGLYKIRFRVGNRVTDTLVELEPGQSAFHAPVPPLPIVSSAPPAAVPGMPNDPSTDFALRLIGAGPDTIHGAGGSLFVFVSAEQSSNVPPPVNPAVAVSV